MSEYTDPLSSLTAFKIANLANISNPVNLDAGIRPVHITAPVPRPNIPRALVMEQCNNPLTDGSEFDEFLPNQDLFSPSNYSSIPATTVSISSTTSTKECEEKMDTPKVTKIKKPNKHPFSNKVQNSWKHRSLAKRHFVINSKKSAAAAAGIPARGWTPVPPVDNGCEREIVNIRMPWDDSLTELEQVEMIKKTYFGSNASNFSYRGMFTKNELLNVAEKLIDCLERVK